MSGKTLGNKKLHTERKPSKKLIFQKENRLPTTIFKGHVRFHGSTVAVS